MERNKSYVWQDYQSTILQTLSDFQVNNVFTDMSVSYDLASVSAHRLLYAAFSTYPSQEVLTRCNGSFLCVYKSYPEEYLKHLLTLIYKGALDLTDSLADLEDLLKFFQRNLKTQGTLQNNVYKLDDHVKVLFSFLKLQFNCPQFSDVTLLCEGEIVYGHRLILASLSPFFKDLFLQCQTHPVIILEGVSLEDLKAVLQFCYCGKVESKVKSTTSKLSNAASFLQIKGFSPVGNKRCQVKAQVKKPPTDCSLSDNNKLLPKVFLDLFNKEELVDTLLVCADGNLKAHSVVLCLLPYFYEMFRKTELKMERREIVVVLSKASVDEVRCLMRHLYSGKLDESDVPWTKNPTLVKLYTYPKEEVKPVKKRKSKMLEETAVNEQCVDDPNATKNLEDKSNSPRRSPSPDLDLLSQKNESDTPEKNQPSIKSSYNSQSKFHECGVCKELFQAGLAWKKHLKIHPDGGRVKCPNCPKTFRKPCDLEIHFRSHTGSQPYSCDLCGKSYALRSSLVKHKNSHTNNKQRICETCGKVFKRQEYLTEHMRTHSGEKPYSCDICGKGFVGKTGLNHHKKSHSTKTLCVCEVCGKSYTRHSLWTHMQTHIRNFQCYICSKRFVSKSILDKHVRGQHYKETTEKCDQCGHGFMTKSHLRRHLQLHQQKSVWACAQCNISFTNENKFNNHMHLKHGPPGVKPYKCDICDKQFMKKNGLIYHRRMHTGEKPCRCSICHKSFMRPDKLRMHEWTHTEKKPYQCTVCGKQWVCKSALNKHMLTHQNQGGDKYAVHCETCGKGFPTEAHLEAHSKIHLNPKQPQTAFLCSICHQIYKDEASLRNHVQLHNARKLYVCNSCGLSFVDHKLFVDHASSSHKDADFHLKCCLCSGVFGNDELFEVHVREQHLTDGVNVTGGHGLENVSIIIPVFVDPMELHLQGTTTDGHSQNAAPIMAVTDSSLPPESGGGATYVPLPLSGSSTGTVLPVTLNHSGSTVLPVSIGNTSALLSLTVGDNTSLMAAPNCTTILPDDNNTENSTVTLTAGSDAAMGSLKNTLTMNPPDSTLLPAATSASTVLPSVKAENNETTEHAETLLAIRNATYHIS